MKTTKEIDRFMAVAAASGLLAALLMLASCAGIQIRPPDLGINKISMDSISMTGMSINVHFNVRNVNPYPITLRFIEYDLELNGRKIGKGYFSDTMDLGEMEKKKVVSTLDISFFKLPAAVKSIFDEDTVHGKVRGKFTVLYNNKESHLPFQSEADIPVFK